MAKKTLSQEIQDMDVWPNGNVSSYKKGSKMTIKEFYDKFIDPRLPQNPQIIKDWIEFLLDYVNNDKAVFAVRNFSTGPTPANSDLADRILYTGTLLSNKS